MARKIKTIVAPRAERRRDARAIARDVGYHHTFNPASIKSAPFVPRGPSRGYDADGNPNPRGKLSALELHLRAVQRRDQAKALARALGDPLGRIEMHRPPHHYRGTPARAHRNRQIIEKMRVHGVAPVSRLSMVL